MSNSLYFLSISRLIFIPSGCYYVFRSRENLIGKNIKPFIPTDRENITIIRKGNQIRRKRPWQPGQKTKWEFSTKRSTNAGCRFFWSLPMAQSTIWSPWTRTRQEWPDGSKTATTRWRSTPATSKTRWSWWDFSLIRPRKRFKTRSRVLRAGCGLTCLVFQRHVNIFRTASVRILAERLFFIAGLYPRWSKFPFLRVYPTSENTGITRWRIKELPVKKQTAPSRLHQTVSDCIVPILLFFFLKTYKNIGF